MSQFGTEDILGIGPGIVATGESRYRLASADDRMLNVLIYENASGKWIHRQMG